MESHPDDRPTEEVRKSATLADVLARALPQLRCFVGKRLSRKLAARESISDVVQSAAREVLVDLGNSELDSSWIRRNLFVAARRKVAEHGRRHGAERRSQNREADPAALDDAVTEDRSPTEAVAIRDEVARVERALESLAPLDREVVVLAVLMGMSHSVIARELGSTEAASRTRLSRALARLSARLCDRDHNDESSSVR